MAISHWRRMVGSSLALILAGAAAAQAPAPAAPPVAAAVETQAVAQGEGNDAVILADPAGSSAPLLLGTAELGGLEIYGVDGRRLGAVATGEAAGLDARHGVSLGGREVTLVAAADATGNFLRFFARAGDAFEEVTARPLPVGFALENVCLFRNRVDRALYAFALGDGGEVAQYMLFATPDGKLDARPARMLHLASTPEFCVADDATGQLYISEQAVGIWRFSADPETDGAPALVDALRLGQVSGEAGGLALYTNGDRSWLIASDSAGRLLVYDRARDDAYLGTVTLAGPGGAPVEEPGGLSATALPLGPGLPRGGLLVSDEKAAGGSNYKLVPFERLASALAIDIGPAVPPAPLAAPPFPTVRPTVETEPVVSAGDAADDPAIWANPADPAASIVIGTDKKGGLNLYDMQGRLLHYQADGKMNNVDLRGGFRLGGQDTILVTASDRTNGTVAIYTLDVAARRLVNVADGIQATGLSDPYGLCMYRGRRNRFYVFVSDPDGRKRQWQLVPTPAGKVRLKLVRELKFGSQTEGCVADDETRRLYVAEEDVGLWRLSAEPDGGSAMQAVDAVARNPRIKDDLEGVGLYDGGGGRGYLVVSSQGNNSYAVYRREGDNAYLGSFAVVADGARGIDGSSETDGLEVTSLPLGPGFEGGALVAQDGRNILPSQTQNFKLVPWKDIVGALSLQSRQP